MSNSRSGSDQPLADAPTMPGEPPQNSGTLAPGSLVGEYRVERELGRGGMGVVYAGRHPVIGKRVAIKVLAAHFSGDPALVRRFVDEARAVNKIGHPNIIDIFAFGQLADGRHYFVMEYLEGESLAARLERGPLDHAEARRLMGQVASALEAAHCEQIVHRDLKPENLWIARPKHGESFIKVLDFGIAKLLSHSGERGMTASGLVIGTPHYMAPEQCAGERVDGRTDVYALGVVLYRIFTGRLPFEGGSFAQIVAQRALQPPPRARELEPLPPLLDALIMDCLEVDAARRPARAAEVRARLDAALAGSAEQSRSEIRRVYAGAAPRTNMRRAAAALLALLAAALLTTLVMHVISNAGSRPAGTSSRARSAQTPRSVRATEPPPRAAAEPVSESSSGGSAAAALPSSTTTPRAEPRARPAPAPSKPRGARSRTEAEGLIRDNPF